MEPNEVFKNPPVFRYNEVLSLADLDAIKHGYIWQWRHTKWYEYRKRYQYRTAIGTINSLFDWVYEGKPIQDKKTYEQK